MQNDPSKQQDPKKQKLGLRYFEVLKKIEQISAIAQRKTQLPILIAVSKTRSSQDIKTLYSLGQRHFGENYAQELFEKWQELQNECPDIIWHFIGRIQSNKIKIIHQAANVVHGITKIKHLKLFAKHIGPDSTSRFLIQLNLSQESQKNGICVVELTSFLEQCHQVSDLKIDGLMIMGQVGVPSQQFFKTAQLLRDKHKSHLNSALLSMGMSGDYLEAIQYGADYLRVGTAIFGAREV